VFLLIDLGNFNPFDFELSSLTPVSFIFLSIIEGEEAVDKLSISLSSISGITNSVIIAERKLLNEIAVGLGIFMTMSGGDGSI